MEGLRIRVNAKMVPFSGEKVVEGTVTFRDIGVHGDVVEPDVERNQPPGPWGIQK